MKTRILALTGLLMLNLTACSPRDDQAEHNGTQEPQHVWKDQVKALDKAQNIENDMNDAFNRRAGEMEKQSR